MKCGLVNGRSKILGLFMVNSSLGVRYFYISGSLNCALRCMGICRAKTSDVDLHFEEVLPWSVCTLHSAHKTLRLWYIRWVRVCIALDHVYYRLCDFSSMPEAPRKGKAFGICYKFSWTIIIYVKDLKDIPQLVIKVIIKKYDHDECNILMSNSKYSYYWHFLLSCYS